MVFSLHHPFIFNYISEAIRHSKDQIAEILKKDGATHGSSVNFGIDLIDAGKSKGHFSHT
jgi:hypothetical protein